MLAAFAFVTAIQGVPLSRFPWWQLDFAGMMRDGVLVGLPNHYETAPPSEFRYVSAVAVNYACSNYRRLAEFTSSSSRSVALGREDGSGMVRSRLTLMRYADRLPLLVGEFDKELRELGVDIPEVQASLRRTTAGLKRLRNPEPGEALTRFPDIPNRHWADKAIHNLRREGVLWGYPDGTFNGKG
jgi:hypothetical protein